MILDGVSLGLKTLCMQQDAIALVIMPKIACLTFKKVHDVALRAEDHHERAG